MGACFCSVGAHADQWLMQFDPVYDGYNLAS